MPPYAPYKELDNSQKEIIFRATLERDLALNNYRISRPSPDIGQDIWILDRKQNFICPAQLKSSFAIKYIQRGAIRRYIVNIKVRRLEASFGRKFLFFFGLFIPDTYPPDFHIGCIPSPFFETHWEFLRQKKLKIKLNGRINLEIDHYVNDGKFFMFTRPLIEVTEYFKNFNAIS